MDRLLLSFLSSAGHSHRLSTLAKSVSLLPDRLLIKQPVEVFRCPRKGLGIRAT